MTNTVNNRVDLELRSSIDQYIEHIKKTFKDSYLSFWHGLFSEPIHLMTHCVCMLAETIPIA